MHEDRRGRMQDERAGIADIRDIECVVQVVDEVKCLFLCAEPQSQHRTVAIAELPFGHLMIRARGQPRIIDSNATCSKMLCELLRRRCDAVQAQGQRIETDARQICIHRRHAATVVRHHAHAHAHEKAHRPEAIILKLREAHRIPAEIPSADDNPADGIAIAVERF